MAWQFYVRFTTAVCTGLEAEPSLVLLFDAISAKLHSEINWSYFTFCVVV
jgi:hypothetical protein